MKSRELAPDEAPRAPEAAPPPRDTVPILSWGDLMAVPDPQYIVSDLLVAGGLSLLVGSPKTGKSTLMRTLAAAFATEEETWMGRTVERHGVCLYGVFDEHPSMAKVHFSKLAQHYGSALGQRMCFVTAKPHPEQLADILAESGAGLFAIDTLGSVVADLIEDGNDYYEWPLIMRTIRAAAAETGTHICLVHHARKAGGERGMAALGSQAIAGSVDTIIELEARKKEETGEYIRYVSSTNRIGHDLKATALDLNGDYGTIAPDTGLDTLRLEVLAMIEDGLPYRTISEKTGVSVGRISKWRKATQ